MKKWHLLPLLFLSMMFAGCSVHRYFILSNSTDQAISIKYTLEDPTGANVIFGPTGEVYQSNVEYYPDWEHKLPYSDLNNSDKEVWIKLGPKSTLVFGTLSNEIFDKATMTSSTGKKFNLEKMTFSVNGVDYLIDASNFTDFFLEQGGTYKYVIQP